MNMTARERSMTNRAATRKGARIETLAASTLSAMGLLEVERIETGWTVHRKGRRIISAHPNKKVAADLSAFMPADARGVRIECKYRGDSRLSHSDLEDHQRAALNRCAALGGVALLVFACPHGLWVLPHHIEGWRRMHPLTPEIARAHALNSLADIVEAYKPFVMRQK